MRFATSAAWRIHVPPDASTATAPEREAEREWRRARDIALHQIQQLVEFWRIEMHELDGPYVPRARPTQGIKYQHPLTGDTWDGEGLQPDWLRQALLKDGYLLDEVKPGTPAFERAKHRGQV